MTITHAIDRGLNWLLRPDQVRAGLYITEESDDYLHLFYGLQRVATFSQIPWAAEAGDRERWRAAIRETADRALEQRGAVR